MIVGAVCQDSWEFTTQYSKISDCPFRDQVAMAANYSDIIQVKSHASDEWQCWAIAVCIGAYLVHPFPFNLLPAISSVQYTISK